MAPAPDGLLDRLLPDGAAGCETFGDVPEAALHPAEEPAVADAVPARRAEFGTGRWCARQALARLGPPEPALSEPLLLEPAVPVGERGMPVWPAGVVGSITHCAGYRAAVVAPRALLPGIGLDAEPHAPLPGTVLDVVALPEELDTLAALTDAAGGRTAIHHDLLLFSAKESVYKAWFPSGRRVLAHHHVRVDELVPGSDGGAGTGRFRAALTPSAPVPDGAPTRFEGRWLVDRGLLLTLAVPAG